MVFGLSGKDDVKTQVESQLKGHLFMNDDAYSDNDESSNGSNDCDVSVNCVYYVAKKQRQVLDEVLFAFENHITHYASAIDRICFDSSSTTSDNADNEMLNNEIISTLNTQLYYYIIDTSSFIIPFNGTCKACHKQIPYPLYTCSACHFGS